MDMNHGVAMVKEAITRDGKVLRDVGEMGIITAFLPEDDKYAVMFEGRMDIESWFTMDKVSFEKFFTYKLEGQDNG